ncbi:MAG: DNA-binding response OmpR family regulator [Arenicella sp.]|jgi:DNA-binding response OmpR family regulator
MTKHVLLAEDDRDFRNILSQYLQMFDFHVTCAEDGEAALAYFSEGNFDTCILDVMMPKIDGFTLAEEIIKLNPEIPFIFLTARKQKEDKIKGLKLGADDYISKPFEADELVLRLNNILKRKPRFQSPQNEKNLTIGKYTFDSKRSELLFGEEIQRLTKRETELIQYLYKNRNSLIKREELLKAVWGNDDFFSGRSMDVFISRLRKYFQKDLAISIESVRGVGLEFQVKIS